MDDGWDSENSGGEYGAQRGVPAQADNQAGPPGTEQPAGSQRSLKQGRESPRFPEYVLAGVGCAGNELQFKTAGGHQLSFESMLASYEINLRVEAGLVSGHDG